MATNWIKTICDQLTKLSWLNIIVLMIVLWLLFGFGLYLIDDDNLISDWINSAVAIGTIGAVITSLYLSTRETVKKEISELSILVVNYIALLNQIVMLKIEGDDNTVKRKKLHDDVLQHLINRTQPKEPPLMLTNYIVINKLELYSSVNKLSFLSRVDPNLYFLILLCNQSINTLNTDIESLNKYIDLLENGSQQKKVEEIRTLCYYNSNFINSTDDCLQFLDVAISVLSKVGEQYYKKEFKVCGYNSPKNIIPETDHRNKIFFEQLKNKYCKQQQH